jgi:hypothetical protein
MFDIATARDFHAKLKADFDDFAREPGSARLALNCIITAYHLHEWVWGDLVKQDRATWGKLGVRDLDSFRAWIRQACVWFCFIEQMANGSKHFGRNQGFKTTRIDSIEDGPFLSQVPYLVVDNGKDAGDSRYMSVGMLIDVVVRFWDEFFQRFYPETQRPQIAAS